MALTNELILRIWLFSIIELTSVVPLIVFAIGWLIELPSVMDMVDCND